MREQDRQKFFVEYMELEEELGEVGEKLRWEITALYKIPFFRLFSITQNQLSASVLRAPYW